MNHPEFKKIAETEETITKGVMYLLNKHNILQRPQDSTMFIILALKNLILCYLQMA